MGRHKGFTVDDYRRLAEQNYSMPEAAYLLGVSRQTVRAMALKHDIKFVSGHQQRMYTNASMVAAQKERGSYVPPQGTDDEGRDSGGDAPQRGQTE